MMKELLKNIKTLVIGAGISKLIGILIIPILTRLYSPDEFGVLSLFNSITLLIVPLLTMRYVITIPLPKKNHTAISLILLCLLLSTVFTIILTFITFAIGLLELEYFKPLGAYIYFLPFAAFCISTFEIMSYWLTRNGEFKALSKCNIVQGISGAGSKLILSLVPISSFGLIVGQIMQQSNGLMVGIKASPYLTLHKFKRVKAKNIIKLANHYSDIPKFRLLSQFLLVFSMQIPIFAFSSMYDEGVVGQLSLSMMLLTLPITLFGNSTGKVYYSKISKIGRQNAKEIYGLTTELTRKLLFISLPVAVCVYVLAPIVFEIIFGEKWIVSGEMASLLSFILVPQFLSSPIINSFNVFNKQRVALVLNITRSLSLILIFMLCDCLNLQPLETIRVYSIFSFVYYSSVMFVVFKVIKNEV